MKIVIVGLGYVGLPLAVNFAKYFTVIGYDINKQRILQLQEGFDRNNDIDPDGFKKVAKNIIFTEDQKQIARGNVIIISVPTPLKSDNDPDLSYVENASRIVGKNMKRGSLIIYESTVYPGCTEEFCLPILENESKMKLGDFFLGFSPERMNPGDKEHTVSKITKLISATHPNAVKIMQGIYGKITNVYVMSSIKAAEAAKIIENVQRDINMALFNELSMLFDKLGLDSSEVFDGAATKWNFIRFKPGLVGGYCIPVNPHYLAYKAAQVGFHPELILAGRKTNEAMAEFIAKKAFQLAGRNGKILILGGAYKENVAELRSSRIKNLVESLRTQGACNLAIYEPLVNEKIVFGIKNEMPKTDEKFDLIIYAVAHHEFSGLAINSMLKELGYLIDIQRKIDRKKIEAGGFGYWAP